MSEFISPKKQKFNFDPLLVTVTVILVFIGYVMVASSSLHLGVEMKQDSFHYPIRQLIHIILGLAMGLGIARVPLEKWEKGSYSWGICSLRARGVPG